MKKLKAFFLKKSKIRKIKSSGKKRRLAIAALLSSRLVFGGSQLASANPNSFEYGGKSQPEISRVLEQKYPSMRDFNQEGSAHLKGTQDAQTALKIPSGGDSSLPSKFSPGSKAKRAAKRDFARRQTGQKPTGSLFAESFSPNPRYGSRPSRRPQPGNFNIPKAPSVRCSAKLDDTEFTGYQRPGESKSMETLSQTLSQEYSNYQQDFNSPPLSKRFDTTDYDQAKFLELAKDPNAKKSVFHKTTVDETRSALHAEMEGHIENPQRLDQSFPKFVDLDFKVDGPYPFTHIDIKYPVGSEILRKQGQTIDIETMAEKMGFDLVQQKRRFCGFDEGPEVSENVFHIVDLAYVSADEKNVVKEHCLQGIRNHPNSTFTDVKGVIFLNDN